MNVYLDASVLVALFSIETFSARADAALRGQAVVPAVSDFGAAEFASAISRKVRTRLLTQLDALEAFSKFDDWMTRMASRVGTTPADIRAAESSLRRLDMPLRAPDALNIAIARRIGAELATFDQKMADCALSLGVSVVPI